jgi:hypothetical protein
MNLKQTYSKQVEQEVKSFRKQVDKIEQSDHPKYNVEGTRQYEIEHLRDELDTKVAELDREFQDKIETEIGQATKEAARSRFFVSSHDKQFVTDITDDLVTKLTFAINDSDKIKAIREYEDKLEVLESEAPFTEVIKQLAEASRKLGDDDFAKRKLRGLYSQLTAGLQTPEQERLEALKADKMSGVTYKYRLLTMTHKAYKHKQAARKTNRI